MRSVWTDSWDKTGPTRLDSAVPQGAVSSHLPDRVPPRYLAFSWFRGYPGILTCSAFDEEIATSFQDLCCVCPPLRLAQEVGTRLGPSAVLFGRLSSRSASTGEAIPLRARMRSPTECAPRGRHGSATGTPTASRQVLWDCPSISRMGVRCPVSGAFCGPGIAGTARFGGTAAGMVHSHG